MKRWLLILPFLTTCCAASAQDLDSLFRSGQNAQIIASYTTTAGTLNSNELEIVAAAYDKLGKLDEEDEVLAKLVNKLPLRLTYNIPCDYHYHGNFILAGGMVRFKTAITNAYLVSIRDTLLGRRILNAYYQDQGVRQKHADNNYYQKLSLKPKWDNAGLMREWKRIDSANAILIAQIIRDEKGFPSRTTIGLIGVHSLFILMQHLDIKWRDLYDQALFDAACKKDIDMVDYAMYRTMTLVRTKQIPESRFQYTLDSLSELKCR